MLRLDQAAAEVARALGLDGDEGALRWQFLQLTDDDVALLQAIHPALQHRTAAFADAFYEHLYRFAELRRLLPDQNAVDRLKLMQSRYFSALTAGNYGNDYVHDRVRVGLVHQHIGLEPKWYIGAYRKYLDSLLPLLSELLGGQPQRFVATYGALLKVVCFDIGIALDTYFHADREAIVQLKQYAETIVDALPIGLAVCAADGRVRSMNRAMLTLLGLDCDGKDRVLAQLIDDQRFAAAADAVRVSGMPRQHVSVRIGRDRHARDIELSLSRSMQGSAALLLVVAQDRTERRRAAARLQESEERFRLTFRQAAVGLAHLAPDGRLLRVNQKLQAILGFGEAELLGMSLGALILADQADDDAEQTRALLAGEIGDYSREKRCRHRDGHYVWINLTRSAMRDGGGEYRFIAVVEDITVRKQVEAELKHLAGHDALTGLPNRVLLQDRLAQSLIHAARAERHVAVMFIDLDRFKNVNDSLGHDVGDGLIVETGRRLAGAVRDGDVVARLGGDEFVVVLTDVARWEDIGALGGKLLEAVAQPLCLQGQELFPTASMGISVYPCDGADSAVLLKNADTAMYRAKAAGRNQFQFYVEEMNARALSSLKLEGELRHAIERGEFVLHYQPQVELSSGRVVGVEALLRWQPPQRPMVMPADFIGLAEETGLIVPIGQWVLRQACLQHRAWCAAGLAPVRIGVNLSARQFRQQDLDQVVARVLQETGCAADCLALEITETAVMEQPERAAETLGRLNAMGVQLAIDDFGTGYSSLSYLKRFPIHALKIDRSFVLDLTRDADDAAIVKAVIALAHSMKLIVIAEGVEDQAQLDFLAAHGCDQMQGYLYSKPRDARALAALLASSDVPAAVA